MKSLLVCLAIVASAVARPQFIYAPTAYAHLGAPLAYPQPVQYKYVPKPVEIEVKSYQFEAENTGCTNSFGNAVPCAMSKRSAQEEGEAPVEAEALPAEVPAEAEVLPAEAPVEAEVLPAEAPIEAEVLPAEAPVEAEVLPAEAEAPVAETKPALELPYYYSNLYNTVPQTYAYNVIPQTYAYTPYQIAPVQYVQPKVQEIEVPVNTYKTVVEKVPLAPLCQNYLGLMVPCN